MNLMLVMRQYYGGMLGWRIPRWMYLFLQAIVYTAVVVAGFLWWRNVFPLAQWNNGLLFWSISLALWKLYEPIVLGGWGGDNPKVGRTYGILVWGAFHMTLVLGGVVTTAVFFGIGMGNTSSGSSARTSAIWAFILVLFWGVVVFLQWIWSIMAAHAWRSFVNNVTVPSDVVDPRRPGNLREEPVLATETMGGGAGPLPTSGTNAPFGYYSGAPMMPPGPAQRFGVGPGRFRHPSQRLSSLHGV